MKNVILLIVDSMSYDYYKKGDYNVMPFLNDLKKRSIDYTKIYAQAPYTEAATMNIYCGQNVLDREGYLKRFKNAENTMFEVFKKNGYETFFNSYQPQCYPTSLKRGVDVIYNSTGIDASVLWGYRFSHYSNYKKINQLDINDYEDLYDILDDNFLEWESFLNDIKSNNENVTMIKNNVNDYNFDFALENLLLEKEKYLSDKKYYVDSILDNGLNHSLFTIQNYMQNDKIHDDEFYKKINNMWIKTFKKIKIMNLKHNIYNIPRGIYLMFKVMYKSLFNIDDTKFKDFLKCSYNFLNSIIDFDLYQRIDNKYSSFKNAPSLTTHLNNFYNWVETKKSEKPFFSCIHIDDIHNPEIFFTYDTKDEKILQEELNDANDVLINIDKKFKGSITHQLSLKYIDTKLKHFFDKLDQLNLLNNTIVAITADHGFSFTHNPLRESNVVNFYLENFQIPLVIFDNYHTQKINTLTSSKDMVGKIMKLAGLDNLYSFELNSDIESNNDLLRIQYCGGGCPDIKRRKLFLCSYNNEYLVSVKISINEEVSFDNLYEVYNLKNDPHQLHNLRNKKSVYKEIQLLIDDIKIQLENIRKTKKVEN